MSLLEPQEGMKTCLIQYTDMQRKPSMTVSEHRRRDKYWRRYHIGIETQSIPRQRTKVDQFVILQLFFSERIHSKKQKLFMERDQDSRDHVIFHIVPANRSQFFFSPMRHGKFNAIFEIRSICFLHTFSDGGFCLSTVTGKWRLEVEMPLKTSRFLKRTHIRIYSSRRPFRNKIPLTCSFGFKMMHPACSIS